MQPISRLTHHPAIQTMLNGMVARMPALVDLAIAVQQIPAPTFAEQDRAKFVQQRFE